MDNQHTNNIISQIERNFKTSKNMADNGELLITINTAVTHIINALKNNNKLILFGNGGSAADAQHIAAELVGRYLKDRGALPAISLTANTSTLTAIGNDYSFDDIFARQIQALGNKDDIAIGISTSGNSSNIIKGIKIAKEKKLLTIGMSGNNGGQLKDIADISICIPSNETPRIQEGHILIGHIVAHLVEEALFG